MKNLLVDSVVWIAAFLKKDKNHKQGKIFLDWFENQDNITVYVNDYIISEIAAHMRRKMQNQPLIMNEILDLFYEDSRILILYTSEENFNISLDIFKKYEKLSLVDSIIVFFYINKKIDYLISFDSGFDSHQEISRIVDPNLI